MSAIPPASPNIFTWKVELISEELRGTMKYSWREDNPISLGNLRSIHLSHYDFSGGVRQGHLIMHESVTSEIIEIFKGLFEAKFPIEKMALIDEYEANDEKSMQDNNTSAFCSRPKTGRSVGWSRHSYGVAIDINPLVNPYVHENFVSPPGGRNYLNRTVQYKGGITERSVCYQLFKARGWKWGGDWLDRKDYQHFEKVL